MSLNGPLAKSTARPAAPDVLIHLHIPKTGGTSLNSMVQHGFPNEEVLGVSIDDEDFVSGLGLARYEYCQRRLACYTSGYLGPVRYATGHLPIGLHRAFDRPAKYFTVIRRPVERVISDFFFRIQEKAPYRKDDRLLTFEEYVESRSDVFLCDYQVRVVSGCPELDAQRPAQGMQTVGAPVQRRHLEEAKRNIEEYFLAAAPLERMIDLALMVRSVYGWPMRRLLTEYKARTRHRPRRDNVSPRLIKIIEECNSHDAELYEWVRNRFESQCRLFEPELSKDKRIFGVVSRTLNASGRVLPWHVRKRLAQLLFYA
jgi:Sulfotransferase family